MTPDDRPESALVRLGREATPAPDPAFADRLDAHLRTLHVEQVGGRGLRSVLVPVLVGLAGVATLVAAVLSLPQIGQEPAVVVMTAAAATDVVLPGEAATPGTAGQELPAGTRIVVGSDGEAVVGGVVLGPGAEAIVVGDRIEVLAHDGGEAGSPDQPTALPPAQGLSPTSAPPPARSTIGPSGSATPGLEPTDRPASTRATDEPAAGVTTSEPDAVDPPTTTAITTTSADDNDGDLTTTAPTTIRPTTTAKTSSTSTATTVTSPTTEPTTDRPRPQASLRLTVKAVGSDRLVLDWALADAGHPARWRIEAVAGDRVRTLAVLRDGTVRTTTVARIDTARVGFRVVALRADGSELLASAMVRQPPP